MQNKYPTKKLGEVVKPITKRNLKVGLPYIGMEDIENGTGKIIGNPQTQDVKSTTFHFDKSKLLFGKLRPYLNKVYAPDFEGHASTEFIPLEPKKDELDRDWLSLWLRSEDMVRNIMTTVSGTRMPRANLDQVLEFKIFLPPLPEQEKIVKKIEELFGKIDEAQKLREEAQADAAALVPAALYQIFEEGKKKKWDEKIIGQMTHIQAGGTPSKAISKYWENGNIPWLRSEACKDEFIYNADRFITREGLENSSAKLLKPSSTLIALVGATIGKTGFLTFESTTNQNIAGLYPKDERCLLPEYLFIIAKSLYPYFTHIGKGKFKMANLSFVKSLKFLLPSLPEQKKIVAYLDSLSEKAKKLQELQQQTAEDLKALKQSILHKAFSGELV